MKRARKEELVAENDFLRDELSSLCDDLHGPATWVERGWAWGGTALAAWSMARGRRPSGWLRWAGPVVGFLSRFRS